MSDEGDRATVQTYLPAHQKAIWKDHADRLGMSQSEFVRTMVQAGRADFEVPSKGDETAVTPGVEGGETGLQNDHSNHTHSPRNNGRLEDRVIETLATDSHHSWDDLVSALTDDIEDRLESTLQELQSSGRVVYSGRHGGYTLAEDDGR
ncbi:hypothetical protein E6P09_11430 [Haloferax mediterranei ATCC 33500]|uniref:Uncharacterized protein n=1 Tax=Haloferax mediterranei (strain ATCC 33500 / DSM 1411 / JCM 8866 / NBRC 14739 / NCIMB 2177 / R-4) TaxID=523841 RepID=I3R577_HALMT|nr:DUF5805 domain-containing protein [Haloferax mediterranei]AFK19387.1 hypothetical protein HFX_1681 [Haloferax mediterranei ATCC 33500]AHZ21262.1 hypothetical protein BM92_00705 [Haloferax mediterranei ATCC 33500]EMA04423.1 hypothetical protein C439_02072 [Haloferax mediterranei ATCC 33500]MDX5989490.1 DUF5805 domain-containing protein [Haloferax mediterranei ATCC 33500]QCQ75851.1 hypothetical protein E6P09_11430 [Haloferax mediterranei ATCC 33500]